MRVEITIQEAQHLVFHLRSMEKVYSFLECTPKEFKEAYPCVLPPVAYVKGIFWAEFLNILSGMGSLEKMADYYGVSESFLKTLHKAHMETAGSAKNKVTLEQAVDLLKRVKNISVTAGILHLKESQLKNLFKEAGFEWLEYIQIGHSDSSAERGRKAELAWKAVRGSSILEDMNLVNSQSPWDFVDSELGKVDCKAAPFRPYTSKSREGEGCWNFRLANVTPGVKVVLLFMSEDYNTLLHWCEHTPKEGQQSVSFRGTKESVVWVEQEGEDG